MNKEMLLKEIDKIYYEFADQILDLVDNDKCSLDLTLTEVVSSTTNAFDKIRACIKENMD